MAVNLLPVESQVDSVKAGLKHKVYIWTTVILVIYLVVISAVGGWWLFLATRQSLLSQEVITLSAQVQMFASLEASIRQQDYRLKSIETFLATRVSFSEELAKLVSGDNSTVTIDGWTYSDSGSNTVSVTASSSADLENYITRLGQTFPTVSAQTIVRSPALNWSATVDLGGRKL